MLKREDFCAVSSLLAFILHISHGTAVFDGRGLASGVAMDRRYLNVFKNAIINDPTGSTSDWNSSDVSPCNWWGVQCNPVTGRVTGLDLTGRNIKVKLPAVLGQLTYLETVRLRGNRLLGRIPRQLAEARSLVELDLSENLLSGHIPLALTSMTFLSVVDLHGNKLTGPIWPSFGSMQRLTRLILHSNSLTGFLPAGIAYSSTLLDLDLRWNLISGNLPGSFQRFSTIQELRLANNELSGAIPAGLGNLAALRVLDFSENHLTGGIPASLGALEALQELQLQGNSLEGSIPATFSNLSTLREIDLSRNKLTGTLDPLDGLAMLSNLALRDNNFTGSVSEKGILAKFPASSFSGNPFLCFASCLYPPGTSSLSAPTPLSSLPFTSTMAASGNLPSPLLRSPPRMFPPPSPKTPRKLPSSGRLPPGKTPAPPRKLPPGPIPPGIIPAPPRKLPPTAPSRKFPPANPSLPRMFPPPVSPLLRKLPPPSITRDSVPPPPLSPSGNFPPPPLTQAAIPTPAPVLPPTIAGHLTAGVITAIVIGGLSISMLLICCLNTVLTSVMGPMPTWRCYFCFGWCWYWGWTRGHARVAWSRSRRRRHGRSRGSNTQPVVTMFGSKPLLVDDLVVATDEWGDSRRMENGPMGATFKAVFPDWTKMTVQTIQWEEGVDDSRFLAQVQKVVGSRHRNVAPILGIRSTPSEKIILYEYMSHSTLRHFLDTAGEDVQRNTKWRYRYRIALGTARGLAHIHNECVPPMVHGCLTPSSIMLDKAYDARIRDIGFSIAVPLSGEAAKARRLMGYESPGQDFEEEPTEKTDVYSFGIILLELVTGKQPKPPLIVDCDSSKYVRWIRTKLTAGLIDEVFDNRGDMPEFQDEMLQMVKVAFLCVMDSPERRPPMKEVVDMLVRARETASKIKEIPHARDLLL